MSLLLVYAILKSQVLTAQSQTSNKLNLLVYRVSSVLCKK